ncbi:MAG TPA: hypothetical protein VFQ92_22870 [Blastocatellia bacterium]|nr:hypothetical protein [Blastocatellia bacterium]
MASFRDPAKTFSPIEVIERLLEITDYYGHKPVLYISSSNDLATYLDSFGFDVYSLTADTNAAFKTSTRSVSVLPNGSRSHESITTH